MTAHPGSFCAPAGATDKTATDTPMICSVGPAGGRARWRRNGPSPARTQRPRGKRAATPTAAGSTLPKVNVGIDPTQPTTSAPAPADLDRRIRDAYQKLAGGPGQHISLADLRDQLPDIPKKDLDAALEKMLDDPRVSVEPEPFGWRINDRVKTSSVHIGGEDRHKISIGSADEANPALAAALADQARRRNASGQP